MENRGKDGIWELRVLSTCSVNSQNLPHFARIYWNLKMENLGKDGIWELRLLSTCSINSRSLPCFSGINSLKNGKSG